MKLICTYGTDIAKDVILSSMMGYQDYVSAGKILIKE